MKQKNLITETFTELAPRYEKTVDTELRRFWGWSYDGFVDNLVTQLYIKENDFILDIATGTAVIPLAIEVEKKIKKKIVGLDITPAMLFRGREKIVRKNLQSVIMLVCASAMMLPYAPESFERIVTGLATHHMDINHMLTEMYRTLKGGGSLTLGDVCGSHFWKIPGISILLRIIAFVYFITNENINRAWAEASAVSNILTVEEWQTRLLEHGFTEINIKKTFSKNFWAPAPVIISASKPTKEHKNDNHS